MPSPGEVAELQQALVEVNTLAAQDLTRLWRSISGLDALAIRDVLLQATPDVMGAYLSASSELSAQWYDEQLPGSGFRATPAKPPPVEQVRASVRWAVSPLFGGGEVSPLILLAGSAQRMVFNASRETILSAVESENGATWARYASANACPFCRMLATRGDVYTSKASASGVVGRGKEMSAADRRMRAAGQDRDARGRRIAGGVKTRGSRKSGSKYHDNCRCMAVAVRPGESYDPPSYVEKWSQEYADAAKATDGSTNAILNYMRTSAH